MCWSHHLCVVLTHHAALRSVAALTPRPVTVVTRAFALIFFVPSLDCGKHNHFAKPQTPKFVSTLPASLTPDPYIQLPIDV